MFVQHALGDRVQGNWPAVIYPAAVIAATGLDGRFWLRLRAPAVALGLAITAVAYLQALATPFPLPVRMDPTALRLAGWRGLAAQVEAARVQAGASFVASDEYGDAAELARLLPPGVTVIGVEPRWALFDLPRPEIAGQTGILVRSARRGGDIDRAPWSAMTEIGEAERSRDNATIERFHLLLVTARASAVPMAVLPRR